LHPGADGLEDFAEDFALVPTLVHWV